MNKILYLIALSCSVTLFTINAQYNFVVQNDTAAVYKTVESAYNAASTGDTIYLPGGSFNLPTIDKELVWIGVGYHPDSTAATFYTRINNPTNFTGDTDNSYITGIHFASNVSMGSNENPALNVTISRCFIEGTLTLKNNSSEEQIDATVNECVINGSIDGNLGSNVHIEKCIIRGTVTDLISSYIDRCILTLGTYSSSWGQSSNYTNISNCYIRNSIHDYSKYANINFDRWTCTNNSFTNNIFSGNITFPNATNTGNNNQSGVNLTTVFDSIVDPLKTFSYAHDFHLKEGSPAIGVGSNESDIGIYGGDNPFKEGGLPFSPHIRTVKIADEAKEGKLEIEITVGAQTK